MEFPTFLTNRYNHRVNGYLAGGNEFEFDQLFLAHVFMGTYMYLWGPSSHAQVPAAASPPLIVAMP